MKHGYFNNDDDVPNMLHDAYLNNKLTNMTSTECMETYGTSFVSKSNNVLLVTSEADTANNSLLYTSSWGTTDQIPYAWLCGDGWDEFPYDPPQSPVCTLSIATAAASDWKIGSHPISYCMVQEVVEQCQLSFSLAIMLVVIFANIAKACISKSLGNIS
jgi:hypothetical protein